MTTSPMTIEHSHPASTRAREHGFRHAAARVGRFGLHLLEMALSMTAGMAILYVLSEQIPATSGYGALFEYGTNPFDLAMGVFMTIPMVGWMIVRGHGRRHSLEMGLAMFAPIAPIVALRLLGAEASLPWLDDASHPATFLAMLLAMLVRRDHFTGKANPTAHAPHT